MGVAVVEVDGGGDGDGCEGWQVAEDDGLGHAGGCEDVAADGGGVGEVEFEGGVELADTGDGGVAAEVDEELPGCGGQGGEVPDEGLAGGDGVVAVEQVAAQGVEDLGGIVGGGEAVVGEEGLVGGADLGLDVGEGGVGGVEGGEGGGAGAGEVVGGEVGAAEGGAQAEEAESADKGEEEGVEDDEGEPFAKPDAEAGDGLDEEELESFVVGFAGDGGAAGPEGGEGEEEAGDAEGVGEVEADEAVGGAVVADGEGEEEGGGEEEGEEGEDEGGAEGVAEGVGGDGGGGGPGVGVWCGWRRVVGGWVVWRGGGGQGFCKTRRQNEGPPFTPWRVENEPRVPSYSEVRPRRAIIVKFGRLFCRENPSFCKILSRAATSFGRRAMYLSCAMLFPRGSPAKSPKKPPASIPQGRDAQRAKRGSWLCEG